MRRNLIAVLVSIGLVALPSALRAQDKPGADKPEPPDPKVLQAIFSAFARGLPPKWDRAWVVVSEVRDAGGARDFGVECLVVAPGENRAGKSIPTCDRKTVFENVWSLNRNIPAREQRRWTSATLEFLPDGKYELKYDYGEPPKAKAAEPTKKKN